MKTRLYYDGECPFCQRYADILVLKKCFDLEICDARTNLDWKEKAPSFKLDDGVILIYNGTAFQGVEAIDMLLGVCKYQGIFFSLQKYIFSNRYLGAVVYSIFKFFRKIALFIKKVPSN